MGLHLTDNAGHVFFAIDAPAVETAAEITGLPPGNAAHIIAVMRVSHGPDVDAVKHHALGEAHDAAGVGGDVLILGIQEGDGQTVGGSGEIRKFQLFLADGDVHLTLVPAVADEAFAVPGDAAGEALAIHRAGEAAGGDSAVVISHKAAHIIPPADGTLKTAVLDAAPAGTGQAAHIVPPVGRRNGSGNLQVPDDGLRRYIAEERLIGPVGGERHTGDAVTVAEEGSGKGRHRFHVLPAEVQIRFQTDREALRPAVEGTVRGKGFKVRLAADTDIRFRFRICTPGRILSPGFRRRKQEGKEQQAG